MFYPRAFEVGKLQLVNLRARQQSGLVLVGSAGVDTMGVGYFKRRDPSSWQLVFEMLAYRSSSQPQPVLRRKPIASILGFTAR